jgi:MerR family transcriptional regulator/heat shock protein HspR
MKARVVTVSYGGKGIGRMQDREGLYIISVAARLLEMHQQTLRKYERAGFVRPQRTAGKLRLYSVEDVEQLRQIKYLVEQLGMSLEGVKAMLQLTKRLTHLHDSLAPNLSPAETERLRQEVARMMGMLGVEMADSAAEGTPAEQQPAPRRG